MSGDDPAYNFVAGDFVIGTFVILLFYFIVMLFTYQTLGHVIFSGLST
jgi:hypothetical protein